ncbi:MAG: hypothetical protein AAGB13_12010, partial [Cyanobacteria bacterium P01_F01_bin.33]
MNMRSLKQTVYRLTCTETTKQLKQERPDLTRGRDLRYKTQWKAILDRIEELRESDRDISLADLEQSEQMSKNSFFKLGRTLGKSQESLEIEWQRILLEAQFT